MLELIQNGPFRAQASACGRLLRAIARKTKTDNVPVFNSSLDTSPSPTSFASRYSPIAAAVTRLVRAAAQSFAPCCRTAAASDTPKHRLLGDRKPALMVTDPPYGVGLDSEWRDRGGLNSHGLAESSHMKGRTAGQTQTTISTDTRADWSEAFERVLSLQVAYVWHVSKFTRQVLDGLLRIGFLHHQQIIWDKRRTVLRPGSGSQSRFVGAAVSIPATFATDCD